MTLISQPAALHLPALKTRQFLLHLGHAFLHLVWRCLCKWVTMSRLIIAELIVIFGCQCLPWEKKKKKKLETIGSLLPYWKALQVDTELIDWIPHHVHSVKVPQPLHQREEKRWPSNLGHSSRTQPRGDVTAETVRRNEIPQICHLLAYSTRHQNRGVTAQGHKYFPLS